MSRTYRRKNYEDTQGNSWDRQGRKTNGYYTTYDREMYQYQRGDYLIWGWTDKLYRPMTKREHFDEHYRIHGDNHHRWKGPNWWFRNHHCRVQRQHDKQEIIKFFKDPDYEVAVLINKIHLPYWD